MLLVQPRWLRRVWGCFPGLFNAHWLGEASCLGVYMFYLQVDIEGSVTKREEFWVLMLK